MLKRVLPSAFLVLYCASSASAGRDRPPPDPATRALFVANCAQCHGEKGDGEGVTQLDRKARSFLEGGFSYGNTKDAIFRSITHGIPGTPMPGFEKALSEAQRRELAAYVIALGPEQIEVDAKDSEIVVRDTAVVVRGKLPGIVEGAREWPRGIAIGTPEGLTFEYRADDVQLIGVRAGRFVNRADWGERGGDALEMLGRVVWAPKDAPAVFGSTIGRMHEGRAVPGTRASARLASTSIEKDRAWLEYALSAGAGPEALRVGVREQCNAFRNALGSGFVVRRFLRSEQIGTHVGFLDLPESAPTVFSGACACTFLAGERPALVVARAKDPASNEARRKGPRLVAEIPRGRELEMSLFVLTDLPAGFEWNAVTQERVIREFCP